VIDVENLRLHYAMTAEHWLNRLERSAPRICEMFGPNFVRSWRFYLAGSMAGLRVGAAQLFQVVLVGPASQEIPWTRAHLYAEDRVVEQEMA